MQAFAALLGEAARECTGLDLRRCRVERLDDGYLAVDDTLISAPCRPPSWPAATACTRPPGGLLRAGAAFKPTPSPQPN
jgi:hypothetical protein